MRILSLLVLLFPVLLLFPIDVFSKSLLQLELAVNRSCALLEDSGVKKLSCLGRPISYPNVKNSISISMGNNHLCSVSSNKINCEGHIKFEKNVVDPKLLSSSSDVVCWSEGSDLFCRGKGPHSLLRPPGTVRPIQIDMGVNHACVVDLVSKDTRELKCWGNNKFDKSYPPKSLINPLQVSVGKDFSCVIDEVKKGQNKVVCFGTRNGGKSIAPALNNPIALKSGRNFTCAIDLLSYWGETALVCWGDTKIFSKSIQYKDPKFLRANDYGMCAYSKSEGLNCDGINLKGESDLNDEIISATISKKIMINVKKPDISAHNLLSTGSQHACAITKNGVVCWGKSMASPMPKLDSPVQVVGANEHTCALDKLGVKCWGSNRFGQLNVPKLIDPIKLGTTYYSHNCAIQKNGELVCWGSDSSKQISGMPKLKLPVKSVTAGGHFTCALDSEGVKCWGNIVGKVPKMSGVRKIEAGWEHVCALHSKGISCWGNNNYKQINVPALKAPTSLGVGGVYTCAEDQKKFICWGYTGYNVINPPVFKNLKSYSLGNPFGCAIDGKSVKCWGKASSGVLNVPKLVF